MDISYRIPKAVLPALLVGALALSGCKSNETKPDASPQANDQASQKSESAAPAAQSAPVAQKPICKEEPKTTSKKTKGKKTKTTQPVDCVPADQAAAPTPAPVAQAPSASGHYDLSKNKPITDSSTAEAGKGTPVKGIDGWEGEISGIPAPGSKFTRLKIGMSTDEVYRLIGPPSGQSSYPTGKSHIPFYHGADRWRQEAIYKGQGRLIFSQQGGWGGSGYNLIWIIHCANEQ
jgi:hypothetical protein